MKRFALAWLLAVLVAGCAAPYAPQEFDFGALTELDHAAFGVVESVREVQLDADPSGIAEALVHSVNPETGDEIVVRLNDGRAVRVLQGHGPRFALGQRVQVLPDGRSLRVE